MNITSCPRCGGRVRSVSIGWKCESCQGFIDMRGEFHQHKEEPFMPPMTNADRIRAMTDWELAVVSVRYEGTVVNATRYGGHEHKFYGPHGEPCANKEQAILMWFNWLQQPAEENT